MAESEEEEFQDYTDVEPGGEKDFLVVPEPEQTPEPPKEEKVVVTAYGTQANAGFPGGFPTSSTLFCVFMLIWTLMLIFYFAYVHSYMVWTQQNPPSGFNGLRVTDVPFYNAAPVSASTSEIYFSFDYYTWMTDYLLILLPPYGIGVLLLSILQRKRSAGIFGIYFVGIFFILLELAKAIYWTLIWAGWFGLSCAKYQFCLSHNPGDPVGTPITQFIIAVVFAYIFSLFSWSIILIQSIVRSGRLYSLYINGKMAARNPGQQFNTERKLVDAKQNTDLIVAPVDESKIQRRRQGRGNADKRGKPPPRMFQNNLL